MRGNYDKNMGKPGGWDLANFWKYLFWLCSMRE